VNGNGKIEVAAVRDRARGQWPEIIAKLCGMPREMMDGRHHPCPKCGGRDRARVFNDFADSGGMICAQCHREENGDGFDTVRWLLSCGFPEALRLVAAHVGVTAPHKSNGHPVDVLTLVAQQKRVSRESLAAYGATVEQGAVVFPSFDASGNKLSPFRIKPGGGRAAKGLFQKGGKAGVFLPVVDGKPRLPQPGETWLVVEGPKDASALHSLGFLALGMPTCQLNAKFAPLLAGVLVVLVPDLDTAGWEGSEKTMRRLFGVAESIRRARLPGEMKEKDGDDVRDILAKEGGETLLRAAIDSGAVWQPKTPIEPEPEAADEGDVGDVQPPDGMPRLITEDGRTEIANGRRLALRRGGEMRWVEDWSTFVVWDGKRWARDKMLQVDAWARECTGDLWEELTQVAGHLERAQLSPVTKFILKSRSNQGISAMVQRARSEKGIPALPQQFDQGHWLLNVQNGTLNLRTHELQAHAQADYLTTISPVAYDPAAKCPLWDKFVSDVFAGNNRLVGYVRRAAGYSLTGDVSEQILFFCYGKGGNGKSTFLQTLMALMGKDYAMKAVSDLLLAKKSDRHLTEIADLAGMRLVACIEADEGRSVAESMVKEMTGGDSIRARRVFENTWEFRPTHKIWFTANHHPTINGTDDGIWRRIRTIPFLVKFEGESQDTDLPEKLLAELPGILNWCLVGLMDWQEHGMAEPDEVKEATREYRTDMDTLGEFIAECCITSIPGVKARARDLLAAYHRWSGNDNMTSTKFGRMMKERGFGKEKSNGIWYTGIGLRVEEHT
jgi:putative DNA primase/helicase